MDDFLQKLRKVVRIVLYGPAISQSDCRKAGPYQLPSNKGEILTWEDLNCIPKKKIGKTSLSPVIKKTPLRTLITSRA